MPPIRTPSRPPHEWATRNESMTYRQRDTLLSLSEETGICLPFLERGNKTGQRVTKAEAWYLIAWLIVGGEPDPKYIDSLGRTGPYEGPGHPTTWYYCHDPPTEWQKQWIADLAGALLIPVDATQKRTCGMTRGQASWLIEMLRVERGRFMRPLDEKWLEDAMAECVREVPLPKVEEDVLLPKLEETS